jgi:hypothetical protein
MMRGAAAVAALAAALVVAGGVLHTHGQPLPANAPTQDLKPAASFAAIGDERARSLALFEEAGKVLQHPRCVNCHPAGDRPLQTSLQPHEPLVVRGPDGFGATGMRCSTCHGAENFDPAGVPGHPRWHLAPIEMAWEGKSLGAICEQVKDPARNGGKSLAELVEHMASDSLVGWGWTPGGGREPTPGSQQVFGALIQAWADSGAACPSP